MRRILAMLCAACWIAQALAADAPNGTVERERALLKDAFALSQSGHADLKALSAELTAILEDPAFPKLDDGERHGTYLLAGAVLYDQRDYEGAEPLLQRATSLTMAGKLDWDLLFDTAFRLRHYSQAAAGLTVLAGRWPEKLADYSDDAVFSTVREARKLAAGPAQAETLMTALFDAKWTVSDKFNSADQIWVPLAAVKLEHGDLEGAKRLGALMNNSNKMIELRADKRFDPLVAADPAHFDVMKQYDVMLAEMRGLSAAAPDKLEGINTVAETLIRLDRSQEALALLQDAIARDAQNPKTFSDRDDQINWAQNQISRALFALGRDDEALAALESAAKLKEKGNANVSQAINLGDAYNVHGRPADALKAVEGLGPSNTSTYGWMALLEVRACAYSALGDKAHLAETLNVMKQHPRDGALPYLSTMLTVGDLDAAAAEVIAELEDPLERDSILYFVQDYSPNQHATRIERDVHRNWLAVRARSDVAKAIAKVGRIVSYPLYSPTY